MRTETITRTIAKYNELTEEQKQKVLEKLNDLNVNFDWWDYTFEDITTQLELLGFYDVKIEFSGFSSQGDGASFTGVFKVPKNKKELKERLKKFRDYSPNEPYFSFETLNFPSDEELEEIPVFRIDHRYSHSNTISSDHSGLREFARKFSDEIYRRLQKEYEYRTSREAIEETIKANDYEFYTDTLELA